VIFYLNSILFKLIFKAIILTKIVYALPVIHGYLTVNQPQQTCAIFNKAKQLQLITDNYGSNVIADDLEYTVPAVQV